MSTRLSVRAFRDEEGLEDPDEFLEHLRDCLDEGWAPALCSHGCDVEPDGECEHGNPSILLCVNLI
jgi:hypothetical protein